MNVVTILIKSFINWKDLFGIGDDNLNLPNAEKEGSDLKADIQNIFMIAFSALMVLFIGVIVYGGFIWVTAGDNEEKLRKAKNTMKNGFIALLITFGSFIVLAFIGALLGIKIDMSGSFLDDIL